MRRFGVLGWPVAHSRSPAMHNAAFAALGLEGWRYQHLPVPPELFAETVPALAGAGFTGANVTVPHKEAALEVATFATGAARAIGAANTLTFGPDGTIHADNTDGYGFVANLRQHTPEWDPAAGAALVLGAGGAARGIIAALLAEGAPEIRLANRTGERAAQLAGHFGPRVGIIPWNEALDGAGDAAMVVNTTSLGMAGQPPLEINLRAPPSLVVTDIVYTPLETDLLKLARSRGLRTADGLGMLLHQAVRGFYLWFGIRPQVTPELRALVEADLRNG